MLMASVTRLPIERIARAALPFLLASLPGLAVIAGLPNIPRFLRRSSNERVSPSSPMPPRH